MIKPPPSDGSEFHWLAVCFMIPSSPRVPDSLTDRDDESLAATLKGGHQEPLEVLYDRHSSVIFAICRQILRDEGEAEDTVQEVFMEAYGRISQFDVKKGRFKAWLMRIARNRAIDRKRHLESTGFYRSVSFNERSAPAGQPKPLTRFSGHEKTHFIGELLRVLTAEERAVIDLHVFGDLTLEETHSAIESSLSAVRHRYYGAMRKLRRESTRTQTVSTKGTKSRKENPDARS